MLTAQKYLGHADPATTLRIYTHLAGEREKADREKVLKIFKQWHSGFSQKSGNLLATIAGRRNCM